MSFSAFKEVSIFEYIGGFEAELQARVFCSSYWQEHCCCEVDTPDGKMVRIDMAAYPPGGRAATTMCRCKNCGKWSPRSSTAHICIDCEIDQAEESFEERLGRLRQDGQRGLVGILQRLRWKSPFVPPRQDAEEATVQDKPRREIDNCAQQEDDIPPVMEVVTFREHESAGGRHWLADALEIPEQPMVRSKDRVIASILRRHLDWVNRDTPRRAIGCSVILLPESEDELHQEIARYESTGQIMPYATSNDMNPRTKHNLKRA